ncbi:DNA/RNA-binding protein KIN17 [Agrilus planipennis]|uniref:DNA/RNA-binding protein KIN17 n=1 Tax=Agrilus planipennis TaxID=224129 RepID=A0A1W4WSB3_AGRPL|nr:DNA/RNA-binding protein KIN17 [Agrilus planipennis]
MPRAEVGTPKYIANKMKAKGLQKLRWYCQMCQKQCRDENGFKCHTMSESHQRQLLLFADNAKKYMDEFSYDFAKGYLDILRRQFGTKRVNANRVYQEYISDRNHLHMNSTRWVTLTGFVKWLGRTGKCIVDETEKGWFITYIDRDPETIAAEERRNKKLKLDKDDEERLQEFIEKQVKRGQEQEVSPTEIVYTELIRNEDEKLILDIKLDKTKVSCSQPVVPLNKLLKAREEEGSNSEIKQRKKFKDKHDSKPKSALDEIIAKEEAFREKNNRKDYWLTEGIIVKIVTKSLGEEFYKQKGVITELKSRYVAIVKLLDLGKKVKIDQEHLETVLPAIGKLVHVVNGAYRDENAILKDIHEDRFCVDIEIASGVLKGRKVTNVQYEDVCKLYVD